MVCALCNRARTRYYLKKLNRKREEEFEAESLIPFMDTKTLYYSISKDS